MNSALFRSVSLSTLEPSAWRDPSRCPYCCDHDPRHWTRWGSYWRYGGDPEDPSKRVKIPRCRCKITLRTFSLPPDSLLPYCSIRTVFVLDWLHALLVERIGLNTLSRYAGVARGTLRYLKARFLRVLPKLRLPSSEGALDAEAFLEILMDMKSSCVASLFRDWKEREPKHSIVGIYLRC